MTKMLIDRQVVEHALHVAMVAEHPVKLIAALRAALAEPPVYDPHRGHWVAIADAAQKIAASTECGLAEAKALCAALDRLTDAALAEPVQEPVAWSHINGTSDTKWHPPQRKPLTEEEIDSIWDSEKAFADIYAIARAIERAHGIDGAPEERHFCPRCGKRTNGIHTCTPPAPLTDEVIADLWHQNGGFHHHFARAIERWLKGNP